MENLKFDWRKNDHGKEYVWYSFDENGLTYDGIYAGDHLTDRERTQFENGIRIGLTRERISARPLNSQKETE